MPEVLEPIKTSAKADRKRLRLALESRRAKVSELVMQHIPDSEISKKLNIPIVIVRKDIEYLLRVWQETQARNAETYFTTDLLSLGEAQKAISGEVKDGNLSAIDRFLAILKRRADMLGYDKNKAKGTKDDPISVQALTNQQLQNMPTRDLDQLKRLLNGFDKEATEDEMIDVDSEVISSVDN